MSSLADRIKIDRMNKRRRRYRRFRQRQQLQQRRHEHRQPPDSFAATGAGDDINLSIQFVLNCGGAVAGSCLGGSISGAYQFVFERGYVPYDTCQPYLACSSDSPHGFCPHVNTTCSAMNTCRTCWIELPWFKRKCRDIDVFPNATIVEYGVIRYSETTDSLDDIVHQIKSEVYARGPVAAAVNGKALHEYHGGVYTNATADKQTTHAVSIIGWETFDDDDDGGDGGGGSTSEPPKKRQAWIVRNSWGQYWGELGMSCRVSPFTVYSSNRLCFLY